ncbi:MAG: 50S ribosomal protein L37 [Candidatus Nitrosotenuis sp.]|jgi:large subunit ribosomal protein L37Ae|uniref:50S ribosomal protein L37 n=1 Tax=Candidatus Nitrosotenuis cloacae TaxID=1603555 RepID=UPI00227EEC6F|nr:50S ribosomal protein L37 [Candidatus Nitrosotenuis cloacae]MDC8438016.1 50S ribosomal protein L37 [Candidatus Nitrosotenuis sp.]
MLKKGGSLIGFGAKYGIKHRKKFTQVHVTLKAKRKCPECGSLKFGRRAVGIWECKKCGYKVAGTAFDVAV